MIDMLGLLARNARTRINKSAVSCDRKDNEKEGRKVAHDFVSFLFSVARRKKAFMSIKQG